MIHGTPPPDGGRPGGGFGFTQTPEEVTAAMLDLIDHPRAELYTNPQQGEMVRRYYADMEAFEQTMGR